MANRVPLYLNYDEGRIEPFEPGDAIEPTVATNVGGGSGATDHGALTGLADDDHTQYHNDTRGDLRYYTKSAIDDQMAGKADSADLAAKQDSLVSGTNIKTVNGNSLLGSGNVAITGTDFWAWMSLASNNTVSTTAYANVTGMLFTALANTVYLVQVIGAYQTAATTTGIGLALDIPSGSVIGQVIVNTSATALGGVEQIADNATTGASTGVRALNTNTPISAQWVVSIGASGGTVQLRQRSEVAASNTVLQAGLTILGYRVITAP